MLQYYSVMVLKLCCASTVICLEMNLSSVLTLNQVPLINIQTLSFMPCWNPFRFPQFTFTTLSAARTVQQHWRLFSKGVEFVLCMYRRTSHFRRSWGSLVISLLQNKIWI